MTAPVVLFDHHADFARHTFIRRFGHGVRPLALFFAVFRYLFEKPVTRRRITAVNLSLFPIFPLGQAQLGRGTEKLVLFGRYFSGGLGLVEAAVLVFLAALAWAGLVATSRRLGVADGGYL